MSDLDIEVTNIVKDIEYELSFIADKHKPLVIETIIERLKVLHIQAKCFNKIKNKK